MGPSRVHSVEGSTMRNAGGSSVHRKDIYTEGSECRGSPSVPHYFPDFSIFSTVSVRAGHLVRFRALSSHVASMCQAHGFALYLILSRSLLSLSPKAASPSSHLTTWSVHGRLFRRTVYIDSCLHP